MTRTDDRGHDWTSAGVAEWERAGHYRALCGYDIFTIEFEATSGERLEPLLVIHGYPTSSFDYAAVITRLAEHRRVLTLDLLGFGLSEKPDIAYTLDLQADIIAAYTEALGIASVALLTHDMGDTVGGELLARSLERRWPVEVTRRVVTNGSIYIEMAHLTAGQQFLLSLADEALPEGSAPAEPGLAGSLAATLSPTSRVLPDDLAAHAELICHRGGNRMLARTIRYIEERRRNERRYTGAIETHPSDLGIVWGTDDPIAVREMAARLSATRPDASLCWLEGIGHYPMVEAPDRFLDAVRRTLE